MSVRVQTGRVNSKLIDFYRVYTNLFGYGEWQIDHRSIKMVVGNIVMFFFSWNPSLFA